MHVCAKLLCLRYSDTQTLRSSVPQEELQKEEEDKV